MTIDERKFVVTALELLRELELSRAVVTAIGRGWLAGAIKALEVALGL